MEEEKEEAASGQPTPAAIDTTAIVGDAAGLPRSSPQARRESLLSGLISASRKDFEALQQQQTSGATTATRMEQIEEGTEVMTDPGGAPIRVASEDSAGGEGSLRVSTRRNIVRNLSIKYQNVSLERPDKRLVQVKLRNFSYYIPVKMDKPTVPTVFNQSVFYAAYEVVRRIHKYVHRKKKNVMGSSSNNTWTPTTVEDIVLPFAKKVSHELPLLSVCAVAYRWFLNCFPTRIFSLSIDNLERHQFSPETRINVLGVGSACLWKD